MTSLSIYKNDIESLAAQLQKLLKVIRHSDPSADELKHQLHRKYQNHLSRIASQVKERFLWEDFRGFLVAEVKTAIGEGAGENRSAIQKKLISDFEKQFIERPVLHEFSPPDPIEIQRRRELRRKRKAYLERQSKAQNQFSKHEILEMVQTTRQQHQARSKLQSLISAIRKIDPVKIETKINQSIKPKDR